MPLYLYECKECEIVFELFQHNSIQVNIQCPQCEHNECKKLIGRPNNRTLYNARENLTNKILPDANAILNKVAKGKDKDFLDISGE